MKIKQVLNKKVNNFVALKKGNLTEGSFVITNEQLIDAVTYMRKLIEEKKAKNIADAAGLAIEQIEGYEIAANLDKSGRRTNALINRLIDMYVRRYNK